MSRLTIDITDQQHQNIKAMAALQGKSIKAYALERLFAPSTDEEAALVELKGLLAQRMTQARLGEVSSQSITEIAEEVLRSNAPTDQR